MKRSIYLFTVAITVLITGCKKFVEVDRPQNSVTNEFVFSTDANATAAMLGVYSGFVLTSSVLGLQGELGAAADELRHNDAVNAWVVNNLTSDNSTVSSQWAGAYKFIYNINNIIKGVNESANITTATKLLIDGEAKFLRAFFYFYLTNMYGKVPLLLSPDYQVNAVASRNDTVSVYQQIITDLKDAQRQLPEDYLNARNTADAPAAQERVRANKTAATALLARVYLYRKDYVNAEAEATTVISNSTRYDTVAVENVFAKNTKEAIWQIPPGATGTATLIARGAAFILTGVPSSGKPYWLQNDLVSSFEAGDKRRTSWIGSVTPSTTTYYFSYKYKVTANSASAAPLEYDMVLRLGEQYLIRAEARINQGGTKIVTGIEDLNTLRKRARAAATVAVPNPLPSLATTLSQTAALQAVENERRHELFVEMGHRWFDLIRTGRADAVLGALKGSNWQGTDQLLPVPLKEIEKNASLRPQNNGY